MQGFVVVTTCKCGLGLRFWHVCDSGYQRYCLLFCWLVKSLISEIVVRWTKRSLASNQGGTEGGGSHHHLFLVWSGPQLLNVNKYLFVIVPKLLHPYDTVYGWRQTGFFLQASKLSSEIVVRRTGRSTVHGCSGLSLSLIAGVVWASALVRMRQWVPAILLSFLLADTELDFGDCSKTDEASNRERSGWHGGRREPPSLQ